MMKPITHDKLMKDIPDDLKELIVACLSIKVENRISIPEIQHTPFFKRMMHELRIQEIHMTPISVNSKIFSNTLFTPS